MDAETQFEQIKNQLMDSDADVADGKMMSAPAITYNGKVFAFFYDGAMTFKLGKDFDIESEGITEYQHLSPFKTKPPMRAWFIISAEQQSQWEALASLALERMKADNT